MGEQEDRIFEIKETQRGPSGGRYKLTLKWDVLLSVLTERCIQAGALGAALIGAFAYAKIQGGLC